MDTSEHKGQVTLPHIAHQGSSIQQPSIRQALPAPAHQQPAFMQPPSRQHPLPRQPQQQALPRQYPVVPQPRGLAQAQPPQYSALPQPPSQQPALPQPNQYPALPQPSQYPALPQPQQVPAIEYNPRGEKRKNTEVREEDRKRIILENDLNILQRKNDRFIQLGRGYEKLYNIVKDCDDCNLQNVMLVLSEKDICRICNCIEKVQRYIEKEDVDEDLKLCVNDLASKRYTVKEKKKFLGSDKQAYRLVYFVCREVIPNVIESNLEEKEKNIKQILRLKRKIKKIRKGEDNEESGSDEDDVDDGEGDEKSDDVDSDEEGEERGNDEDKGDKEREQSESEETEAEED